MNNKHIGGQFNDFLSEQNLLDEVTTVAHKRIIISELKSREPIFHHSDKFGATRQDILRQMCDEFWEVGASGNVYTKEDVISTLLERYNDPHYKDIWETKDFAITQITPDHYLLTYILIQNNDRITRRSTIWCKTGDGWKILYHQGTIMQDITNETSF